jgi:dTDP-4-dehydrorhamnose reductase
VNEPLTTARFSALYGIWYPHRRDEPSFWLALLNQIDGIRLAMREVRRFNPDARLIQTDDLGRTYATTALRDQAAFDNSRRWMGWDLLCGRVTPDHCLWSRLCGFGLEERLRAIADDPCPPDIIGVNHYLTSDRFLDHRVQRYPPRTHGSNGRLTYADTEAVRVLWPPSAGLAGALREAWDRYGIPLAVTEVHIGCTRDEQMRWTADAWRIARELRDQAVDIRAVTSWALLGSQGWDRLLTATGRYEPGAFDVSNGRPRPTAIAGLLKSLRSNALTHPVLAGSGWWRRPIRLHHPHVPRPASMREHLLAPLWTGGQPLLITGASGTLGGALAAACRHRDLAHVVTDRGQLDLTDEVSIGAALDVHRPWAVINAAGWVRVDDAEADPASCLRANAEGAAMLARACDVRNILCIGFSSDLVFDGEATAPYVETDRAVPLCIYGRSKAEMEEEWAALPNCLVIRTAAFFSPFDPHNFAMHVARALADSRVFPAANDLIVSPTYVPHLVDATLDLAIDGATGIWHLTNGEALDWAEFGRRIARACHLDEKLIQPVRAAELGFQALRPAYAPLASTRGTLLPSLDEAIERFAHEAAQQGTLRRSRELRPAAC